MEGATFVTNGSLTYDATEPFAVTLTVRGGAPQDSVTWTISRQPLASGLVSEHGEGDVGIAPDSGSMGRLVCIELAPPQGRAILKAGMSAVQRFLAETYELVPEGGE